MTTNESFDATRRGHHEESRSRRSAHIARDADGNLLGTAMFLSSDDLAALGVEEDAHAMLYRVTPEGEISVVPQEEANDQ